jgi:predicted helicase
MRPGDDASRRIDFAHFAEDAENGLPTLRVLGWDDDDTDRKLDLVERRLKEKLAWRDGESITEWRIRWREAFVLRHREVVTTSKQLAEQLAKLAQKIRVRVLKAIALESAKGPLRKLYKAFQDSLIHDLDEARFADMYAQTIAYGLLSARMSRPSGLTADDAVLMIPNTNPFLKELMEEFRRIGGRDKKATGTGAGGIDFDELGVNDVVELRRRVNVEAVVADFGRERPGEDPVIHFYEYFMEVYDKKEKVKRGAFYTPKPVVSFIVRSVDEILREEFDLPLGLADTTTWGEMSARNKDLKFPQGVKPADHFVQILDPATGTGTFLVETIDLIHRRMVEHWRNQKKTDAEIDRLWNEYVPEHLLPRLYGFELMMAPYAIAHMKIGLKLADTGYRFRSEQRLRVFLTNSLEPPTNLSEMLESVARFLAHEARAANLVKGTLAPTVVLGNPPYSIASSNLGAWIVDLCERYKTTVRDEERQIQALSDDYVKFYRLAEYMLERASTGVLSFITNNGYLNGHLFRDLRSAWSNEYQSIYLVNAHGNLRTGERTPDGRRDANVFDIQTGVAIAACVRKNGAPRQRRYQDVWGSREEKYAWFSAPSSSLRSGETISPLPPESLFLPFDQSTAADWQHAIDLRDWFGTGNRCADAQSRYAAGFASQQDEFAIAFSRTEMLARVGELLDPAATEAALRKRYRLCKTTQWSFERARQELSQSEWHSLLSPCAYRPCDTRWTVFHRGVVSILRAEVMRHLLDSSNIALMVTRGTTRQWFAHAFVARGPVDRHFIDNASESMYVFPLRVHDESRKGASLFSKGTSHLVSNISRRVTELLCAIDPTLPADHMAEAGLHLAYAILYSEVYRQRYAHHLASDFPRVFVPQSSDLLRKLLDFGADLVSLHLFEPEYAQSFRSKSGSIHRLEPITSIAGRDREIRRVGEKGKTMAPSPKGPGFGRVYINDTAYFDGVPEAVWKFHIGGY